MAVRSADRLLGRRRASLQRTPHRGRSKTHSEGYLKRYTARMIRTAFVALALTLVAASSARGQAIGGPEKGRPTPDKEPGISTMTVMDRPAFRVLRDWAEPGSTRIMHGHANTTYHVFTLLTGQLRLTIEGQEPTDVKAGDVVELQPGARHTFTNTGTVAATIVEVFGKPLKQ